VDTVTTEPVEDLGGYSLSADLLGKEGRVYDSSVRARISRRSHQRSSTEKKLSKREKNKGSGCACDSRKGSHWKSLALDH
jgi:hypothetical protein